jgi:hypothetical protein
MRRRLASALVFPVHHQAPKARSPLLNLNALGRLFDGDSTEITMIHSVSDGQALEVAQ